MKAYNYSKIVNFSSTYGWTSKPSYYLKKEVEIDEAKRVIMKANERNFRILDETSDLVAGVYQCEVDDSGSSTITRGIVVANDEDEAWKMLEG